MHMRILNIFFLGFPKCPTFYGQWMGKPVFQTSIDAYILTFKFLCNHSKAICAGNGSCYKHSSEIRKTQNSQKFVISSKATQRAFVLTYLDCNYNGYVLQFSFSNLFFYNPCRILITKTSFFKLLLATIIKVILATGKTSIRIKQLYYYLKCN